jgi:membrane protein DedA with SNARE-associated domain
MPDPFSSAALAGLIHKYGLLIVFCLIAIESAGVPVPGEATLIAASLYAGTTHNLDIVAVVSVAATAAIVGDNIGYLLGRTLGLPFLRRYGGYIGLDENRLAVGQYLFLRHGGKIVFCGRFVALLRVLAAVLAGANRMPWPRFLVANALGGFAWAAAFGGGAYLFGEEIRQTAGALSAVLLLLALVAILTGWFFFRRHETELVKRAREALNHAGTGIERA